MRREPDLGTPGRTRDVLRRHDLHAKKKYGQNFLVEPRILEEIVRAAGITREANVLEIGPGIGTLTQYLAYSAAHVTAVEIDRALLPVLQETLEGWDNVDVVHGDILKLDIPALLSGRSPWKIAANLPYYVTTPILMDLLERDLPVSDITVMVQKEVADRMTASPGTKDYGALSLAVQYRCLAEIACTVPPVCFLPQPKVDSAVVHLRMREDRADVSDERHLFSVIKAAFAQRRKTLANALGNAPELALSREQARAAIRACGLPENVRGEALSLEEFIELSKTAAKA